MLNYYSTEGLTEKQSMKNSRSMSFGWFDYASFITYIIYAAGSLVIPVALVQLADELRFSLKEGGMSAGGALNIGRTLTIIATMLLSGFAAGRWGKRRMMGISLALVAVGMGLCSFSPAYAVLFLALSITGIGEGIIEGLTTPFIRDLHPEETGRYLNFAHAFWSVGVVTTVIVSGILLRHGVSWRLLLGGVSVLALIPASMLLIPFGKTHKFPEHPEPLHWKIVWNHGMKILRTRRFYLFFAAMFFAGGGEYCLTFWAPSHIQLYFGASEFKGGLGVAFFAAGMVFGRTGWGYLLKQHHLNVLIVLSALAGTVITLFIPMLTSLWLFFIFLFLSGIATAPFWPSTQSYCADRLHENDTTMLFILLSCSGVPGCAFFAWFMGFIGDRAGGLNTAFYLVPACYFILALLISYDWFCPKVSNRQNNRKQVSGHS